MSSDAVCAEEAIVLADTALYRAKALGRNQGVGIVPSDAATANPSAITPLSLQESESLLIRTVNTKCPIREDLRKALLETSDCRSDSKV